MNRGILFPVFLDSLAIFILFFLPFSFFPHFSLLFSSVFSVNSVANFHNLLSLNLSFRFNHLLVAEPDICWGGVGGGPIPWLVTIADGTLVREPDMCCGGWIVSIPPAKVGTGGGTAPDICCGID